jgi:hypothetical protein
MDFEMVDWTAESMAALTADKWVDWMADRKDARWVVLTEHRSAERMAAKRVAHLVAGKAWIRVALMEGRSVAM